MTTQKDLYMLERLTELLENQQMRSDYWSDPSEATPRRWGKIVVTFDNGLVIENDGWDENDGNEWTDWVTTGEFTDDTDISNSAGILGLKHDRVLAIEWIPEDTY